MVDQKKIICSLIMINFQTMIKMTLAKYKFEINILFSINIIFYYMY